LFEGKKIGSVKNLEKLDREIKKLNKQLEKVVRSLNEKHLELESLKNRMQESKIEDLQIEINHINEEYISITTKHEQYAQMLSSADVRNEDLSAKLKQLEKDDKILIPKSEAGKNDLSEIEQKLQSRKKKLQQESQRFTERSAAYNDENIILHQQENRVNSIEQEVSYKKNTVESTRERILKNSKELERNDRDIQELIEKSSSSDDDLVRLYKEKEKFEEAVNEAEKVYYSARGSIDENEKQERDIHRQRESIDTILMEFHNKLSDVKIELKGVKERLSVEFNINLNDMEDPGQPISDDEDLEILAEKVEKIRQRLEVMGPINPMAMEAFEEIQDRHGFITSQKDDLVKAKESLMTTISEIDLVAKATFLEAFEKIKSNFIEVFRSLFSDHDDCDLVLSDYENPLDSSVEIIAKPKGKKPLTINQLSGGEKTLTATSLLFAIYLLKPAPFCIFDEVDAPLDDANIDKFNSIIHKFSDESQFVIVTHNKRTMNSTDVIYGITMPEQGISKVVPVDLRQLA